jgi:hypothetical protein
MVSIIAFPLIGKSLLDRAGRPLPEAGSPAPVPDAAT